MCQNKFFEMTASNDIQYEHSLRAAERRGAHDRRSSLGCVGQSCRILSNTYLRSHFYERAWGQAIWQKNKLGEK